MRAPHRAHDAADRARGAGAIRTLATAGRVLRQLSHDPRSIALLLFMPSLIVGLFAWLMSDQEGAFDLYGGPMLALFAFILMFVITSVTTLRERRSGTLERLMTTPMGKGDFITGYALAFGLAAAVQAIVTVGFAVICAGSKRPAPSGSWGSWPCSTRCSAPGSGCSRARSRAPSSKRCSSCR